MINVKLLHITKKISKKKKKKKKKTIKKIIINSDIRI